MDLINNSIVSKTNKLDISNKKLSICVTTQLAELHWLTNLYLNECDITILPILPKHLIKLDISNNKIEDCNFEMQYLEVLNISNNLVKEINHNLKTPNLKELLANSNQIKTAIIVCVEILDISNNPIENYSIPENTHTVYMTDCGLNNFPELPNVRELIINTNNISEIPKTWSEHLTLLEISDNQLKIIESYPPNIELFDISNNQITELPDEYPPSLSNLDIRGNLIECWHESYNDIPYFSHDELIKKDDFLERQIFYNQPIELEPAEIEEVVNNDKNMSDTSINEKIKNSTTNDSNDDDSNSKNNSEDNNTSKTNNSEESNSTTNDSNDDIKSSTTNDSNSKKGINKNSDSDCDTASESEPDRERMDITRFIRQKVYTTRQLRSNKSKLGDDIITAKVYSLNDVSKPLFVIHKQEHTI